MGCVVPFPGSLSADDPSEEIRVTSKANIPRPDSTTDAAVTRAITAARVAAETRGTDLVVLDLRKLTPVFDFFVIATGTSRRQIHAMADEIELVLKQQFGDLKRGGEGYEEGRWVVLDYGDVVVHLLDAEAREFWDLEGLWGDAVRIPLPESTPQRPPAVEETPQLPGSPA
jgi:ribosome-associated protein